MPTPFPYKDGDGIEMRLTPDTPVYRPQFGLHIARVASYWSDVELYWAIAYTYLLANTDKDAFATYYSLRDWRRRKSEFFKAADAHRLPGPLKSEAHDLYAEFDARARDRNRIVHGTWAWSPQYDDSIFLAQPRQLGSQLNRVFTALINIGQRPEQYPTVAVDLGRGTYERWTHQDFEDSVAEIRAFAARVSDLGNRILSHSLEVVIRRLRPGT